MSNRRDFLLQTLASGGLLAMQGVAAAAPARKPLRVLMLGATGFLGPHYVPAAVERGHKVSVFIWNRDPNPIEFPAGVERLMGDRNNDLESIKNRDWDAVIDLATYGPGWVRSLGEALGQRVKHYTFISTIAAYEDYIKPPGVTTQTHEDGKLKVYKGSEDPYAPVKPGTHYGELKAFCEREAEKQFPARVLILRPCYIVGPGDRLGALGYWPIRMEKGGEMIVTGERSAAVQFVDARDLADWNLRLLEAGVTGIYNAVGPEKPMNLQQMIQTASQVTSPSATPVWVPSSALVNHKDRELWGKQLFWSSEPQDRGGYGGTMYFGNKRALQAGLKCRPLRTTLADTLAWHKQLPAEQQSGMRVFSSKPQTIPWPDYLRREKEFLSSWRAQSASVEQ